MGYDANFAKKPLTLEEADELIIMEREQKHIIKNGYHIMPSEEYIELRDKYIDAVKLLIGGNCDQCVFRERMLEQYKDPDDAEKNLEYEFCSICGTNAW